MFSSGPYGFNAKRQPTPQTRLSLAAVRIGQAHLAADDQVTMLRGLSCNEQAFPGVKLVCDRRRLSQCFAEATGEFLCQRFQTPFQVLRPYGRQPRPRGPVPVQVSLERGPGDASDPTALRRNQGCIAKLSGIDKGLLADDLPRLIDQGDKPQTTLAITRIEVQPARAQDEQIIRRCALGKQHLAFAESL